MAEKKIRAILSANLKKLRNRREWSQMDLAEKANISMNFVSEIERGRKWPYPETLQNLAKAFNIAVYELFKPEDESDPDIREHLDRFSNDVTIAIEESMKKSLQNVKKQYIKSQSLS
jgi:transcriptional regulator with XRE-family HTH domain